jgi:hypothetical protein
VGDVLVRFEKYLGAHATVEELMSWVTPSADDAAADEQGGTGYRVLWNLGARVRRDPMNEPARAALLAALEDLIEKRGGNAEA